MIVEWVVRKTIWWSSVLVRWWKVMKAKKMCKALKKLKFTSQSWDKNFRCLFLNSFEDEIDKKKVNLINMTATNRPVFSNYGPACFRCFQLQHTEFIRTDHHPPDTISWVTFFCLFVFSHKFNFSPPFSSAGSTSNSVWPLPSQSKCGQVDKNDFP